MPNVNVRYHSDKIENLITRYYNQIESVFVHVGPVNQDTLSVIIAVEEINGLDSKIPGHFGRNWVTKET